MLKNKSGKLESSKQANGLLLIMCSIHNEVHNNDFDDFNDFDDLVILMVLMILMILVILMIQ